MKVSSVVKLSFISLFFYELLSFNNFGISPDFFFILIYISLIAASVLILKKGIFAGLDRTSGKLYLLICLLFLFSLIRGVFLSSGYFDYKYLFANVYGGASLLAIVFILVGLSVTGFFVVIKLLLKYLPYLAVLLLILNIYIVQIYPRVAISIFVLLLMYTYLNRNHKIGTLIMGVGSVALSFDWRANIIRLIFSFMSIVVGKYYRTFYRYKRGLIYSMFLIPFIGIYYSVQNESVFQLQFLSESFLSDDFSVDTRTLLYSEVFEDLFNTNTFLFGKGILGNYKSDIFDFTDGRIQVEVGFLKYIIQIGFVGFMVLGLLIFRAAFLGIKYSNNKLSKIFSIFLAFHFCFLFIEAIPAFSQYYFFVWTIVGVLLSKKFRSLSDLEIKALLYTK